MTMAYPQSETATQTVQNPQQGTSAHSYYETGDQPDVEHIVWVFGTDLSGKNTRLDARIAAQLFGAEKGVCSGPTGRAYAIATRDAHGRLLPMATIHWDVKAFLTHARKHRETTFWINRIGNGMAGLGDQRIAPLFATATANCRFPIEWRIYIEGTVQKTAAGSRAPNVQSASL